MSSLLPLFATLSLILPVQQPDRSEMIDAIKDLGIENEYIRKKAEEKLVGYGARLVPVLRKQLESGTEGQKRLAAQAASLIGVEAVPLVDILARQLSSSDYLLVGMTLQALGRIGAPARSALPALDTVSDTHLRAHDTLRYLVCRLLLEKKKLY